MEHQRFYSKVYIDNSASVDHDDTGTRGELATTLTIDAHLDNMEGALRLDVIVRERAPNLKQLAFEDQGLLVRRDSLLIPDLRLDDGDRVARHDLQHNLLARRSLDKDPHLSWRSQRWIMRDKPLSTKQKLESMYRERGSTPPECCNQRGSRYL